MAASYEGKPVQRTDLTSREIKDNIWMIRPHTVYEDEWKACTAVRGRIHQRYVYGDSLDCDKWMTDFTFAKQYEKTGDIKYAEPVIIQELERRQERLRGARANTVWEYRTSAPKEWDTPLHDNLINQSTIAFDTYQNSSGVVKKLTTSSCSIM